MNFTKTRIQHLVCLLLVALCANLNAQIFWEENFEAEGIPSGWTTEDLSTNNALWTYCPNPDGTQPGCSPLFNDQINMQSPFNATTADNGFMTLNSDAINAPIGNPHISQLTTDAIDCTDEPVVYVRFEAHIGVFDLDAVGNALLRVSNNGTDWTEYDCFPELTTGVRWSDNPEIVWFDISDVAGGQSTVYLQWQWLGAWEYFWNLDDILLSSEVPIAPHDMRVNSNWFAVAPNAMTPINQIETFGFMADIQNVGGEAQTNVNLNVTIVDDSDPGTNLYDETLAYGTIAFDSLAENQLFPDAGFTPAPELATYTGTYTITADSVDADPDNNVQTFSFEITDNVFAKDNGELSSISPAESNWDDTEPFSWAYGNHYHVVEGDGWYANQFTFGIANAADVAGESIIVYLYEWTDTNEDGDADPDERSRIGYAPYVITGNEGPTDLMTQDLLDIQTDEVGVALSNNTDYILSLEYGAADQTYNVAFVGCRSIDYGAQIFRSEELGMPRYAGMLGVNEPLDSEIYTNIGFGWDIVPVARLHITDELEVNTVTVLSEENEIAVFPSPAEDNVNVKIDLVEEQSEINLQIMDGTGKVVQQREFQNFKSDTVNFILGELPTGSYYINVNTPAGNRSVPFVIQR